MHEKIDSTFTIVVYGIHSKKALDATLASIYRQSNAHIERVILISDQEKQDFGAIVDTPFFPNILVLTEEEYQAQIEHYENSILVAIKSGIKFYLDVFDEVISEFANKDVAAIVSPIKRSSIARNVLNNFFLLPHISHSKIVINQEFLRKSASGYNPNFIYFVHFDRIKTQKTSICNLHSFCAEDEASPIRPYVQEDPIENNKPSAPKIPRCSTEKNIWVFGERAGNGGDDNAWALFEWVFNNLDWVESYFVINPDHRFNFDKKYQSSVLRKGSLEWELIIDQADLFIFNDSAVDILLDRKSIENFDSKRYLFLTHGCLGFFPGVYMRNHRYFDLITSESLHASRIASEAWNYPISKFAETGLARWDRLQKPKDEKYLLFLPTWRKSLSDANFLDSFYFSQLRAFLSNQEIQKTLKKNNYKLKFSLHFRALPFIEHFRDLENDVVEIINPQETPISTLLETCSGIVTDTSSVFWDVAYQGKSVLFWQFDKKAFLDERELTRLFLPTLSLFAPMSHQMDELVANIQAACQQKFKLSKSQMQAFNELVVRPKEGHCQAIANVIEERFYEPKADKEEPIFYDGPVLDLEEKNLKKYGRLLFVASPYFANHFPNTENIVNFEDIDSMLDEADFDTLVIEPHLVGRGSMGQVFFSPRATNEWLKKIASICAQKKKKLVLVKSPYFALADKIDWKLVSAANLLQPKYKLKRKADKSIKASIIVPIYNGVDYLKPMLDSVLGQKFSHKYEVIIVDDGSTDGSSSVIKGYQETHKNLHYLYQANARQGFARNYGLGVALGEYVMFVDGDDVIDPEALSELYHSAKEEKSDISCGLYSSYNLSTKAQFINQSCFHFSVAPRRFDVNTWPAMVYEPSSVCKLYSKDFLDAHNIRFAGSFHEDEFFCTLALKADPQYSRVNKILYTYFSRANASGTQQFGNEKLTQILFVATSLIEHLNASEICKDIIDQKKGYLLTRMDRFLFKRGSVADICQDSLICELFYRFLETIPRNVVEFYAVNFRDELLLFMELASKKDKVTAWNSAFSAKIVASGSPKNQYDFYGRVAVTKPAKPKSNAKTNVRIASQKNKWFKARHQPANKYQQSDASVVYDSISYKLGNHIVRAVKYPGRETILLPWNVIQLAIKRR